MLAAWQAFDHTDGIIVHSSSCRAIATQNLITQHNLIGGCMCTWIACLMQWRARRDRFGQVEGVVPLGPGLEAGGGLAHAAVRGWGAGSVPTGHPAM